VAAAAHIGLTEQRRANVGDFRLVERTGLDVDGAATLKHNRLHKRRIRPLSLCGEGAAALHVRRKCLAQSDFCDRIAEASGEHLGVRLVGVAQAS